MSFAIDCLQEERFNDLDLELARLRENGVLSSAREPMLDKATQYLSNRLELKAVIGRALEIQDIYAKTHHVFIHAQNSQGVTFPVLVKELMQAKNPGGNFEDFEFLRLPNNSETPNIETYSKSYYTYDHENQTQEDLISVDGYLFHNEAYESAIHFMSQNSNIMHLPTKFLKNAIHKFYPELSENVIQFLAKRVKNTTATDPSQVGNLFAFCIPKEKSFDVQYRAHPFGEPCHCHNDHLSVLEKLQEEILDSSTKCSDPWGWNTCPQYRIFTPALTQENGIKIHLLASNRDFFNSVQKEIHGIVEETKARARFVPVHEELLARFTQY